MGDECFTGLMRRRFGRCMNGRADLNGCGSTSYFALRNGRRKRARCETAAAVKR